MDENKGGGILIGSVDLQTLQLGESGGVANGRQYAARLTESEKSQPTFQETLRSCLAQAAGYPAAAVGCVPKAAAVADGASGTGVSDGVAGDMQASAQLVSFVAAHEGYSATAYRGADAQNLTIGYGHVVQPGESAAPLTQASAVALLKNDLRSSVAAVNREFAGAGLSQSQFDALVSFSYNLGDHIWSRSPQLKQDILSGASAQTLRRDFASYDHCNGQELSGLYTRRMDEWNLFANGQYRTD